ncbi:hypothetical protein M422DRAFT_72490 [Sphaerobolus stellatus SS14]|uniref:XPG-I domain-containing protein n=1 Tax=Sphaerobolus stellatus (strain SS14) TaxID=990650 RepID=A0A0C9UFA0_SPHS4|nr:hypothetical protein M422DRAFT_72490 [Sphaerobolus stellatus SS14]
MGVQGLWDILRPAGENFSLARLAVESGFLDNKKHRGYRIGIDASIWFFHALGGREGENPELRTIFFRCARLAAMPYHPIFVFDGPKRPKIKRGKAVGGGQHWMVNSLRTVLEAFGFECRTAPGEAEAELAYLNRIGVIDAVLSDDVDCFLFAAKTVIRNSSATLSGNKKHGAKNSDGKDDGQHVNLYRSEDIERHPKINLTHGGLILIALLRGGDYDQQGIDGCGINVAHALARAGFGDSLLEAARSSNSGALAAFLPTWRQALRHELTTNASGFATRKSPSVAKRITEDFPRLDVLRCYTHPITSESEGVGMRGLDALWNIPFDVAKIARVCEMYFEWGIERTVIKRFRSFLWPGAVLRTMLQIARERDADGSSANPNSNVETPSKALARTLGGLDLREEADTDDEELFQLVKKIHSERQHSSTDNILEYRLEIDPTEFVAKARSGIQGTRIETEDSAAARFGSDVEDDDGEEVGKKRRGTKPPPDPNSTLRIWLPAVMVDRFIPRKEIGKGE